IAAAVCDGGLLRPVMCQASLRWMTGQAVPDGISREAVLPPRGVPCPLLMVVGSRSMVWEQDALELQADYRRIGADCSVVVP
ncbi:hypothetical protein ABTQ05_21495, partial [Acinetobacter baumannii]